MQNKLLTKVETLLVESHEPEVNQLKIINEQLDSKYSQNSLPVKKKKKTCGTAQLKCPA